LALVAWRLALGAYVKGRIVARQFVARLELEACCLRLVAWSLQLPSSAFYNN